MPAKMKKQKSFSVKKYPGVFYIVGRDKHTGKEERIYYIKYLRNKQQVWEKAGRQYRDNMTPAKASLIRAEKITGKRPGNAEKRRTDRAAKAALEGRQTIKKLWEQYKVTKNPKGLQTDESRFQMHLLQGFGEKEPSAILPLDIDRLEHQLKKSHQPGTVKNVLELLRRIINFGVQKQLCEGLSFKIKMPKVMNEQTEYLTDEQFTALLQAIAEDLNIEVGQLMKLALFTGLRRGELLKLQWDDVDFHRGLIDLRDPKGGVDQKLPLNSVALAILAAIPKGKSPYVFPGRDGGQRVEVGRAVRRIRDRAGLPKSFRPLHGLRHAYASKLADEGVDLYHIQKLLTHKSSAMTQRYAHLQDETLRKASEQAVRVAQEEKVVKKGAS